MSWLMLLGYALPELIGLGVALTLLYTNARPGAGRRLGSIGLGIMLAALLLGIGVSVFQQLWLSGLSDPDPTRLGRFYALLGVVRILIGLVSMAGLIVLVQGLCRATQDGATQGEATRDRMTQDGVTQDDAAR